MKKLALFAVLAMGFIACREDNGTTTTPTTTNDLAGNFPVGAWEYRKLAYVDGKTKQLIAGTETTEGCTKSSTWKIFNNNKFERIAHVNNNGTCELGAVSDSGTYVYDAANKKITTTTTARGKREYIIASQTDQVMYIRTYTNDADKNGDGTADNQVYVYTKISN